MKKEETLRFKIKREGFELELEGPFEFVRDYMEKMVEKIKPEDLPAQKISPQEDFVPAKGITIEQFPETTKGRIQFLQAGKFFQLPRSLSQITEQLRRDGFHYNTKTVDNALRLLIREGTLRRLGKRGEYQYVDR